MKRSKWLFQNVSNKDPGGLAAHVNTLTRLIQGVAWHPFISEHSILVHYHLLCCCCNWRMSKDYEPSTLPHSPPGFIPGKSFELPLNRGKHFRIKPQVSAPVGRVYPWSSSLELFLINPA